MITFLTINSWIPYMLIVGMLIGIIFLFFHINKSELETDSRSLEVSSYVDYLFKGINLYRESKFMKPLQRSEVFEQDCLRFLLDYHADETHNIPPQKYMSVGILQAGYTEKITEEKAEVKKILHRWKSDKKTRDIILNPDVTHLAVQEICDHSACGTNYRFGLFTTIKYLQI